MSNRDKVKLPDGSVVKVYISRKERRIRRNARRAAVGAPLERKIHMSDKTKHLKVGKNKSYNKAVELVDPETGVASPPQAPVRGETAFLLEGYKFAWGKLGGAAGFARWARTHPTKFYELATKLLPSQVELQAQVANYTHHIIHALPPPPGWQAPKDGTVGVVYDALRKATPGERDRLLEEPTLPKSK